MTAKNKMLAFFTIMFLCISCNSAQNQKQGDINVPPAANQKKEMKAVRKSVDTEAMKKILGWGEEYFKSKKLGTNGKACSDCHENGNGLEGTSAIYPKYFQPLERVVTLQHVISYCRTNALKGKKDIDFDSTKMISLTAYISRFKGNGKYRATEEEKVELQKTIEEGRKIFYDKKFGSNNKACADCHENGEHLIGKALTYPKYVDMADRIVLLAHMINYCYYGALKTEKYIPLDSDKMTSLLAYISQFKG